ncbi:MAG: DUF6653 family protein [Pseudomonadota bacterium]
MARMQWIADLFAMDEETWARHANPLSGWTRVPILPLICLFLCARAWIGWWCLLPIALLLFWTWYNPRAFPPPETTDAWASRAVMGERVWLARDKVPIPAHHALWADILTWAPVIGLMPLVWGVIAIEIWPLILGLVLTVGVKLWFLDRMVWLYQDMATQHPAYAAWQR